MPDRSDYLRRPKRRPAYQSDLDLPPTVSGETPELIESPINSGNGQLPAPAPVYGKSRGQRRHAGQGIPREIVDLKTEPRKRRFMWGLFNNPVLDDELDAQELKQLKLIRLIGAELLCLLILFGMISGANWMATDSSGDYVKQDPVMGTIKVSLIRRATNWEGELSYRRSAPMALVASEISNNGKTRLTFATSDAMAAKFHKKSGATFEGTIQNGKLQGLLVDAYGIHKLSLEKNVITSLFRQFQSHIPNFRPPDPPSWVNQSELSRKMSETKKPVFNQALKPAKSK
jgi:hypothetical protein